MKGVFLVVVFLLLFVGSVSSQITYSDGRIDVGCLNGVLEERGASWRAADNERTGMTRAERMRTYGEIVQPEPFSVPRFKKRNRKDLPDSLSWHDWTGMGVDWMSPVRDQRQCGSCWAFAAVGQVEGTYNIVTSNPELDLDLSEQTLVSDCFGGGNCMGGSPYWALVYVMDTGIPDEDCYRYRAISEPCNICDDWEFSARKIRSVQLVTDTVADIQAIKEALMIEPVISQMEVYTDFNGYHYGIYEHISGDFEALHVVVLVGWNDADSCWYARNSWGASWGIVGYFKIRYGESGIGRWTYIIGIDTLRVSLPDTITICVPDSVELVPDVSGGAPCYGHDPPEYSYLWSPGNGLSDSTAKTPVAYVEEDSWFYLTVTDINGTEVRDSVFVRIDPHLDVALGADTSIYLLTPAHLIAHVNGGTPPYDYHWEPESLFSFQDTSEQTVFLEGGTEVSVCVEDARGCFGCDTTFVSLLPNPYLSGVEDIKGYFLTSAFPNPTTDVALFFYGVPREEMVEIAIYNILGQKLLVPVFGKQRKGIYRFEVQTASLPRGVYLCRMKAGSFNQIRKVVVFR
ncbi:T9SS type A sorting domain-containing protein [bacterium]|nr:T9SS type A sorting domain-containing protein [bacterium]